MGEFNVNLIPAPPDITERAYALMAAHHKHLGVADIAFFVTEKAQKTGELTQVIADTDLAEGQYGSASFVIWFALDYWATLSDDRRTAIVDHELCHCQFDNKGTPVLRDHDISEFNEVIARNGMLWDGASETLEALRQMPPKVEE